MRRTPIALLAAALGLSTLAFAPVASQQAAAQTDHTVTFTESGTQTVDGDPTRAGANLGLLAEACTKDAQTYCDTVLVTVEQPVADENEGSFEVGTGTVAFGLAPTAQGADFDVNVFITNEDGTAVGEEVATSGNFPGCATVCATPASIVIGSGCGTSYDECGGFDVDTNEVTGTAHFLVQVVYYTAVGGYSLDIAYERTDGRNADGTTGGDAPAPAADAAARVDVTMFGDFPTERGGDWNAGGNPEVGSALGQDFEAAYLEYKDDTFIFTLDMTELPAIGGTPEVTRYGWSFVYVSGDDRLELELDGKFTNYSRGTCDPTAGSCPPVRDPGMAPFLIRGNCYADSTLPITMTYCEELANVQATFDVTDGTITVPIPASALAPNGVAACDRIEGSSSFIGAPIWAAPSAFLTNTAMPYDDAAHHTPLVVPYADESLSCDA